MVNELTEEEINMVEDAVAINSPEYQTDGVVMNGITYYTINDNGQQAYLSQDLQDWVYQMCAEYGIPGYEKLIISKLYCESGFNANAKHRNKNGTVDYGIAQINSSNHSWLRKTLGVTDFMDPYQSIRCGVYMMSENLKKNGFNESMALVAYNTGKNGISSTSYSRKVLRIKDAVIAC
ncbi:lytic transglycosylase domain-containing protein [Hungatella hathewayi]|uniref:lytic transglycosylase domain-containing protein n=1 Tax=Hungatella hathewayi TaxID=154046 RepID=UPI003569B199